MSAEEDYSAGLLENSHNKKPTHSQVIKEVINWFYGPDAGKLSKEWSKRLLRPRPRLTQALSTTTPEYVTYDTANYPVLHGPSARIPYHVIILGGVLILAVFYLLLFLVISRLRCCRKNQQRTARRRSRETWREANGLYHIEGDVLGSGNVHSSSPKLGETDDSPPPSYEDAMIACGHSPQQLPAQAKTNQATPSNVNNDEDVELN
ncbi:uncharacterized protein LOC124205464 [Daphnia pulex]|uniref:uncharacterized protein LOC124205464 n=1 Tax=Daphnia pulex TaxID=6669 RepID=UPI001EE11388|nr:uncharacterized protein LOC124205464 [Daphnia pulex]XP_046458862.1 uncharacterized protein LOC124205464 [Daphnia pulex]